MNFRLRVRVNLGSALGYARLSLGRRKSLCLWSFGYSFGCHKGPIRI